MADQPKKQRKMLSSYSIVFLFLIFTAILTWFVPQSVVNQRPWNQENHL